MNFTFLLFLSISSAALISSYSLSLTDTSNRYLNLPTLELYNLATKGNNVDGCYIAEADHAACDLYVKSTISGADGDYGWPKSKNMQGTGCVMHVKNSNDMNKCIFYNARYNLTQAERESFCTSNRIENAVAQLKHAIRNNACSLPSPVHAAPFPEGTVRSESGNSCSRPSPSTGWQISSITLDRVHRCQSNGFVCNSVLTHPEYSMFDSVLFDWQQRQLFLSRVNVPRRSATKNIVFAIAGQQTQKYLAVDGQASGITGQYKEYADLFENTDGSVPTTVAANSVVNAVLSTGYFPKSDTFVGLVFDARFNYEYTANAKRLLVEAYFEYIRAHLTEDTASIGTIYLAGHSRGGCLSMRLAKRVTAAFPHARVVVHNYDGVCVADEAIFPWTEGEFGVDKDVVVASPVRNDYYTITTDMREQLPNDGCLAVRSFLSGSDVLDTFLGIRVNPRAVRGFSHVSHTDTQNSLMTNGGFAWYTQSFHDLTHGDIDMYFFEDAALHVISALNDLPCDCGGSRS